MRKTNDPKTMLIRLAIVLAFAGIGVAAANLFHTRWAALPVLLLGYVALEMT